MSSSTPRRSPRLLERERHAAAKAADAARKASCVPAGPPNTFVSTAAPAAAVAPTHDDLIVDAVKKRLDAVNAARGTEAKCRNATLLMNFVNLNAIPLMKKNPRFRDVVIAKCREFLKDADCSADLKESCAALLAVIAPPAPVAPTPPVPTPPPAPPAPAPAPAPPTPSQVAAFSAPIDEDCAFFASCIRQPTFTMRIPPRPAARDQETVVKHIDLLLKITEHAVGSLIPHTELFEYILATAPVVLLTNKNFRDTVAGKVKEFMCDMKAGRITHEPLTRVMATLSDMIRSADSV